MHKEVVCNNFLARIHHCFRTIFNSISGLGSIPDKEIFEKYNSHISSEIDGMRRKLMV